MYAKPLVSHLLRSPQKWTVQGFGMMRCYFGPKESPKMYRLNLWDSRFAVPNVSTIHDHPWSFESLIVAGAFVNVRYDIEMRYRDCYPTHQFTTIKTGEGGGMGDSLMELCVLTPRRPELYKPGDEYTQAADEIHETIYADGTVTLNKRIGDTQRARVFWPATQEWVDAMPREATPEEASEAIAACLKEWF